MSEYVRRTTFNWDTRPPTAPVESVVPDSGAGLIARRYLLHDLLGRGGEGEVWRATDRLSNETVAVKLLDARPERDLGRVRREVTALRWLRLPGVVTLRDDGVEGLRYFIVMDLVEGTPFPGRARPSSWEALAPVAVALLESLARVHHAGVVHRDLKPPNVLVRPDGRPVILDFGVATGHTLALEGSRLGLTALYAAPEQMRGQICDRRTDLYAVGVMLFEALTGVMPHGNTPEVAIRRRLASELPSLGRLRSDLPDGLTGAIERLLAPDPQDRPASAEEALASLGGDAASLLLGRGTELPARVAGPSGLRPLFRGPDPFFHLVEDAAAALWSRTGGESGRVRQELAAWVRAGLAWWDGDKLVVERQSIDRLAGGLPLILDSGDERSLDAEHADLLAAVRQDFPEATVEGLAERLSWSPKTVRCSLLALTACDRVWPLGEGRFGAQPRVGVPFRAPVFPSLSAVPDPAATLLEIARLGELQLMAGRLPKAAAIFEQGLLAARQLENHTSAVAEQEAELLRLYCVVSISEETTSAFGRALYALERAVVKGDDIDAWIWLTHGLRAAYNREPERALELLEALPRLPDEDLETWRQGGRVRAAGVQSEATEQRTLEGLAVWAAGHESREARLAGWWGNLRYRQNRFADALGLHLQSARRKKRPDARLASLVNAVMSALEALQNDRARALAEEALAIASALRHPGHEAVAIWALRHGAYRAGAVLRPKLDLPDAAARLGTWYEGIHAFSEAVVAWRLGSDAIGLQLARRAGRCFWSARQPDMARLMEALEWVLHGAAPRALLDAIADPSVGGDVPDLVVQTLGLLHLCTSDPNPEWGARALMLAAGRPRVEWGARLDVVSFDEAIAMVEGRWVGVSAAG